MGASMKIDLKSKVSAPSPTEAFRMMMSGAATEHEITQLAIDALTPYPDQPFRAYTDEKLTELAEDIKANGVLSPILVRPLDGGYQILAGHNRVTASRMAGLFTVPCIVKEYDDDTAKLVLVNTNLNQRQELLPSEKAFAYKMQMDATKRQGKRTDLTLSQFGTKLNSAQIIAEMNQDSKSAVFRYIRLTALISPLLNMIDEQALTVGAGVELSYLNEDTQRRLYEYMGAYKIKLDLKTAAYLRASSHDGELTRGEISSLLSKPPKPAKEKTAVKLKTAALQQYFPAMKQREIEREILSILEQYFTERG